MIAAQPLASLVLLLVVATPMMPMIGSIFAPAGSNRALHGGLYRKLKLGRSGDEVRSGWHVT